MAEELWRKDASTLATMIRARDVSSAEVVEAHLARIDAVNPALNAVVRVLAEPARESAAAADRALAAGEKVGPLHGVPFTVKENVDLAGTPTTWGVPALAEAVAPIDAPIVARLRAAGAIPIGRTNLPDMALRVHTDSSLHGLTRNPWRADRTTGGSSGGEAVALATGMSPLGLGNDLGGSLRNPAHCCGISALKPTTNRLPMATVIPPEDPTLAAQLMSVDGPMARRVADLRLALALMAGPDPRDPFCVPAPLEQPEQPGAGPLRVALVAEPPGGPTDPGIAAAVRLAGAHLAAAGYEVVEVTPPAYEQAVDCWGRTLITDLRAMMPVLTQIMGADAVTFLSHAESAYPTLDTAAIAMMYVERHGIARAWSAFMAEHPIVVSPVWTQPAFEVGFDVASPDAPMATLSLMRPVLPANLLGLPSAVVPCGMADGMPVGVQCIGRRFREDQCLAAAEAIERATGGTTPIDPTW
ncbi:MAG: indole acetimide hydrolase [Actinobacteria bacterium]|nr:indole acetimide hydrolase [Actinomycetota bacterium]